MQQLSEYDQGTGTPSQPDSEALVRVTCPHGHICGDRRRRDGTKHAGRSGPGRTVTGPASSPRPGRRAAAQNDYGMVRNLTRRDGGPLQCRMVTVPGYGGTGPCHVETRRLRPGRAARRRGPGSRRMASQSPGPRLGPGQCLAPSWTWRVLWLRVRQEVPGLHS